MNASITNPLALVARILLAAIFVASGISKITGFEGTVGYIASKGLMAPEALAALAAALEVIGGLMLIAGYHTKLAALALAAFTLIAGIIFHDFWAAAPEAAYIQQIMFMKNLSIAGGLILLATGGIGDWSLEHHATKAHESAE